MTDFARVQQILNKAIADWETKHHRPSDLSVHGPGFGWATRDQLVSATGFGQPLITADQIANRQGDQTNLVIALRTGVAPFPRMPKGGPFLDEPVIAEIVEWINGGALPQPSPPPDNGGNDGEPRGGSQ